MLVARDDGADWQILPGAQTFEAKLLFVIGDIGGEKLWRYLTDYEPSSLSVSPRKS